MLTCLSKSADGGGAAAGGGGGSLPRGQPAATATAKTAGQTRGRARRNGWVMSHSEGELYGEAGPAQAGFTSTNVCPTLPPFAWQRKYPFSVLPSWLPRLMAQQRLVVSTTSPTARSVRAW